MSGAPTTSGTEGDSGGGPPVLTPAAVDAVLADFRTWLLDLANGSTSPTPAPAAAVDLFTLVGQFTALRHEVNLQTKAVRAAVEQNATLIDQLATRAGPAADESDDVLRPVAKALVDIADALALSRRQMEKLRESADELAADLEEPEEEEALAPPPPAPKPGFFAGLFGGRPALPPSAPLPPQDDRAGEAIDKLRQFAAAAADGYAMSLRRVERALPALGLEPITSVGLPFDPERMEAVEVVGDSGEPPGTVVEDVRPGYRWRGKVFRFAQVKVAR